MASSPRATPPPPFPNASTSRPAKTKGQDLDNSITGLGTEHMFRTGYVTLGQERNPYIPDPQFGDYGGTVQALAQRPHSDGVNDFIIIHLGSGMDKKVGAGLQP